MKKKKEKKYTILSLIIIISMAFHFTGFTETTKTVFAARSLYDLITSYDSVVNNYDPQLKVKNLFISNQTLHLDGYAIDQDCMQNSINLSVYIYQNSDDKIEIANFKANSYNSEANSEYSCGYYHGFNKDITVDKTGIWYLEIQITDLYSDGTVEDSYNSIKYFKTVEFTSETFLSADPSILSLEASKTSSYIKIDINDNAVFNVSTDSNWLTVSLSDIKNYASTNIISAKENGFYVFADINSNKYSRTGKITITHGYDNNVKTTITVTQKAFDSKLSIEPTEITANAKGVLSQSYIYVNINNTGAYNVSTDSDWLTVGTSSSKSYAGTQLSNISNSSFYIFANENKDKNSRTATITVTHTINNSEKRTITVEQEGATITPELTVNPTSLTADGEGILQSQSYITVTTKETGTYNIMSNVDWLKFYTSNNKENAVTNLTSVNNSKIYLFADTYIGSSERKATITVTHTENKNLSVTITVTQKAAAATLSVSRDIINASVNGETDTNYIEVKANNTSGFSVKSESSWISLSKTSDGEKSSRLSFEKSDKFYLFVDKTTGNAKRTGKVTVTGNKGDINKVITIQQAELIPVLKASTNTVSIEQNGNISESNQSIFIDTEETGGFTATVEDTSWLRLISDEEDSFSDGFATRVYDKSSYIYLVANENQTGSIRTGEITIKHTNGSKTITINVSQSGAKTEDDKTFFVDTETHDFDDSSKVISSAITITADDGVNWTVTSNDSTWLKVTKNSYLSGDSYGSISGNGKATFYIIAEKNETFKKRGEWIEVTAPGHDTYQIHVTQPGKNTSIATIFVINQIRFSVTKKVFGIKKTSKIKIQYPDLPDLEIEDNDVKNCVESIQYKSNKPKIVSINKQGVIKGKKKGRAKIHITITLKDENDRISRTVKLNVKVGKAKINLKFLKK